MLEVALPWHETAIHEDANAGTPPQYLLRMQHLTKDLLLDTSQEQNAVACSLMADAPVASPSPS